jgi:molybdopterin-guanine dinucleotide biosynthesis protein A
MKCLGIILAGGTSTRMSLPPGHSKADLTLGGHSLLEHVCRAVRPEVDRLAVVVGPDQAMPRLPEIDSLVRDSRPGAGPLAGVADALRAAGSDIDRAFVTSCDVPLLSPAVVRLVLDRLAPSDALWAVPLIDTHLQVLASAMRPAILPAIETFLASGRRDLHGLAEELAGVGMLATISQSDVERVDPSCLSFADADTPEELATLEAILPRLPMSRR